MIHNTSYNLFLKISRQSTITIISSCMASNYLTLNPSKTEFLLIGFPQKTSKMIDPLALIPFHSTLLKHFISPAISFFCVLKPTFSLFPTLHNFSVFPSFAAHSRTASFNQSLLRINAIKHLRIHYHLQVLVLRGGYIKLYFTYLHSTIVH